MGTWASRVRQLGMIQCNPFGSECNVSGRNERSAMDPNPEEPRTQIIGF